jgi:aspartyl-tRNA(Asn)/glutamyl-tRNA(Gln) amidotransferase subunit A
MPTNAEICRMEAAEIAGSVRAKELSPLEVVEAVLERMKRLEPTLRAFCTPTPDLAREEARRLEDEISSGVDSGPLAGVPVGIKDLHAVKGRCRRSRRRYRAPRS